MLPEDFQEIVASSVADAVNKVAPVSEHTLHNYVLFSQRPGVITARCKSCGRLTTFNYTSNDDEMIIKLRLRLSNHGEPMTVSWKASDDITLSISPPIISEPL